MGERVNDFQGMSVAECGCDWFQSLVVRSGFERFINHTTASSTQLMITGTPLHPFASMKSPTSPSARVPSSEFLSFGRLLPVDSLGPMIDESVMYNKSSLFWHLVSSELGNG